MLRTSRVAWVFALLVLGRGPLAGQGAPRSPVPGLGALAVSRLDELPRLRHSVTVGLVSSYDRTEGNDDGFSGKYSFVRQEARGLVLADLTGPGVLYRFHTPTPTSDTLEFYFDGETQPRLALEMRDLVLGRHAPFLAPLTDFGGGGYWTYTPIPYEKSLKVIARAARVQFIQFNYARYGADAGIRSWQLADANDPVLAKAREVAGRTGTDLSSLVAPPGATVTRHEVSRVLQPGVTTTLFRATAGGRIVGIRLWPASAFAGRARSAVLRGYFDGATAPAIESPVGDLFGFAFGRPTARSLLLGTTNDTAYLYFPMPYDRTARLDLTLDGGQAPIAMSMSVATSPVRRQSDEGRFYAFWRRENPTRRGQPFTFLRTAGQGHVVGLSLQAQGVGVEGTEFFEGDDRAVIDGDTLVHGTGSEDSFNGGWYGVPGRWDRAISLPFSGSLGYSISLGRTGGFRTYLGDAYAYQRDINFTIEHGTDTGNSTITDYAAVTYFYSRQPPTTGATDLSPAARRVTDVNHIVLDPSWLVAIDAFSFRNATLAKRSEKGFGQFLALVADSANDVFGPHGVDLVATTTAAGRYRVSVQTVHAPDGGIVRLFDRDQPVGTALDTYSPQRERGELTYVATLPLSEGDNVLHFRVTGTNPAITGPRHAMYLMRVELDRDP
ncbi:MAG: glycoside hydrolase family 172 protein [Gemmatimonadaceae bacterium]